MMTNRPGKQTEEAEFKCVHVVCATHAWCLGIKTKKQDILGHTMHSTRVCTYPSGTPHACEEAEEIEMP